MLQGNLDVLLNREEFVIFMQSRVPLGPGKFDEVVLVTFKPAPTFKLKFLVIIIIIIIIIKQECRGFAYMNPLIHVVCNPQDFLP